MRFGLGPTLRKLTNHELFELCQLNRDWQIERTAEGEMIAMPPAKMREYTANGARLGWLIDPLERRIYVYGPPDEETCLDDPERISVDPVLPGFVLDVRRVME